MRSQSKKYFLLTLFLGLCTCSGVKVAAQDNQPSIHIQVNMVQLNVAVTDSKGNYITGLRPQDFEVTEDNIPEKLAVFAEGHESVPMPVIQPPPGEKNTNQQSGVAQSLLSPGDSSQSLGSLVAGANVFILFDTSNYMYRGFVFAQDAIADFVRSLETADKIAFYSYSRDLYRAAPLTADRSQILRAVRTTVAGDDAALYNTLLLTLKDAANYTGKKVVVVFSNGPDSLSVVPPEDVAELAQSVGVSVYMISTQQAKIEPVSTVVFERMTAATGGKAYFAKTWRDEKTAFAAIRDDLGHLYSLNYYPQANPNRGWRTIKVRLVGDRLKKYQVRTRNGYRPQLNQIQNSAPNSAELRSGPQSQ
jgi:Ca-activated chloride channel homolog